MARRGNKRNRTSPGQSRPQAAVATPTAPTGIRDTILRLAKKPTTWLLTIVLGGLAAWGVRLVDNLLENVAPTAEIAEALASGKPLVVLHMDHIIDPAIGADGFVRASGTDSEVDVNMSTWEMTVVGTRADDVVILNMSRVAEGPCTEPLRGTYRPNSSQGGQAVTVLYIQVDAAVPRFSIENPLQKPAAEPYFGTEKLALPKGEKNTIQLRAVTAGKHCKWRVKLNYLADGQAQEMIISAPGDKPFEVTREQQDFSAYDAVYLDPINDPWGKCLPGKPDRVTGAEYVQYQAHPPACAS